MDLLVVGIGELATPLGGRPLGGRAQGRLLILREAYVLVREGRIAAVGTGSPPRFEGPVLHCEGRCVTPGLVDPHTHAVFAGNRVQEFLARARGERYTGGGILTTVRATRAASEEELVQLAAPRLGRMLAQGVTTVEVKSGYGLTLADELKMLRAVRRLAEALPLTLVPTFMGAHAFPPEVPREEYVRLLVEEMLPAVAAEGLARFCDVFCDRGFYTVEEARRILEAARRLGLGLKVHADELAPVGAAELAAELRATSAEHLLHVSPEGIRALAEAGTVAVLLPGTAFLLEEPYPPARPLIEAGVPVALGTDFNPGSCPLASLPFAMSLAILKLKMSPEEVLTAATLNAAAALGLAQEVGSLEAGKKADLVVWDAATFAEIPYWMGQNLAWAVVKEGRVVLPAGGR
ncbi:imidazolonepropionase [Thermus sp.]|uniref:imidazolonepropionase n=1 Tax=Thermus sp. TaxID=275 RepID=UPI00262B5220|nr:imidazolonepropionase [Thermus sp.]MCS7216280.1 imidazolonepropionase [Candidatus Bipolaricaulota bacterium]MCX7850255.1 imidazolonepropionase [Thermus sp.]MDW8151510.1 imidazolonepropionase [Candidatus Bipolaricaulota bacterium]